MSSITREQVEEQLHQLAQEQLAAVSQFTASMTYLKNNMDVDHRDLLLAAESSLRKGWDTPQEDAAWRHL